MHNLCYVNCFEIGDHWLSVPLKNAKGNRKSCMLCRSWLKSLLFIPVCLLLKKKKTAKIQKLLGVIGWKRIGVEIQWLCLSINVLFVGIWDWKTNIFALFEIHLEYVTCSKGCGTWFRYCHADFLFWFGWSLMLFKVFGCCTNESYIAFQHQNKLLNYFICTNSFCPLGVNVISSNN